MHVGGPPPAVHYRVLWGVSLNAPPYSEAGLFTVKYQCYLHNEARINWGTRSHKEVVQFLCCNQGILKAQEDEPFCQKEVFRNAVRIKTIGEGR